jgi:iron-sulfur cluster assembly protein
VSTTPIVLSEVAADRLKGIISEGKYKAIRFAMQQTEKGNLAPSMFLVDEVPEGDMLFNERGVSVLMDKDTAEVLEGAEVDLVKEGESEHFVLTNAMASGCGCGCGSEAGGSCGCGCGDSAGAEQGNA